MVKYQGNIYIISAPSGAGKSSLINALSKQKLPYETKKSISHTTRNIRPGEMNGKDYHFISKEEFQKMIDSHFFLEHAKVFNNYYGTAYSTITNITNYGINAILAIDWQGMQQIKIKLPEAKSIFILPPSIEELARRLRNRGQDNEKTIYARMKEAILEMSHYCEYDYLIINRDFSSALLELKSIIHAEQLKMSLQRRNHCSLINKLLAI
ncbi:guanylate kinase [Candidatus Ishikawella capsulata]|uniref:Guanylate kinase n=1 Tax=Candidatus Ishikawaella capsulata Mpkobe TaxID=476281 RepID=C5WDS6_9ENTR|nr:guanylate kinase [Candidatus Ishikawaella capsulata]BAH83482.1 guanylate kinase [Candidatus Ishikawaella capsulata Mpkobe]